MADCLEDFGVLGIDVGQGKDWLGLVDGEAGGTFFVLAEHWEALGVFLALRTQWRMGVWGGFLGLDYAALWAVLRGMVKRRRRAETFEKLRIMEREALAVLNAD